MSENEEKLNTISDLEETVPGEPQPGQSADRTELEEVRQALTAKAEEAKALEDKYLRLAAEFENFKKLSQKQKQEYVQFANESLLRELLPVVDNLERALKYVQDGRPADGLVQGVELTLKQFMETLAKFGVRPFVSVGATFDPSRHQAVAQQESETAAEHTIIEEYQKGYQLHDRILRAAMVVVATRPGGDKTDARVTRDSSKEGDLHG